MYYFPIFQDKLLFGLEFWKDGNPNLKSNLRIRVFFQMSASEARNFKQTN